MQSKTLNIYTYIYCFKAFTFGLENSPKFNLFWTQFMISILYAIVFDGKRGIPRLFCISVHNIISFLSIIKMETFIKPCVYIYKWYVLLFFKKKKKLLH
jgi:hypothetical protein